MSTVTSTTTSTTIATETDGPFFYLQIKPIQQGNVLDPTLNNKFVYASRDQSLIDNTVVRSSNPMSRIRINPTDHTLTISDATRKYYFSTGDSSSGQVLDYNANQISYGGDSILNCQLGSMGPLRCVSPANTAQAATLQYCQCSLELNDLQVTYDRLVEDECLDVNLLASPGS